VGPDSTVTAPNGVIAEAGANNLYQQIELLRRPGRGREALRPVAKVFLRLFTRPPLRPFSLLASFSALPRTKPHNRPSATACGFFPFRLFINPLHHSSSLTFVEAHCSPILLSMLSALLRYVNNGWDSLRDESRMINFAVSPTSSLTHESMRSAGIDPTTLPLLNLRRRFHHHRRI
jgi:hypothetical protein